MDAISQARRYFFNGKGMPPSISGSNGHSQALSAASALTHGFCLSESDAMQILKEWNALCQPPWNDRELEHKLRESINKPPSKPRGHLLNTSIVMTDTRSRNSNFKPASSDGQTAAVRPRQYGDIRRALPEPLADGTRQFLRALFQPGDGIRFCLAKLNEEGRENPDGVGSIYSYEEWLKILDAKDGNPNRIFKSADKAGIYVGLNPLKIGSRATDSDVTAFRYVLLEFDTCSIEEQFAVITASNIPCAAITSSGGKSVHAVVHVNAKDATEYARFVQIIWTHFAGYDLDVKNRNAARLSRLPNCERLGKRQELLSLKTGADSFVEWLSQNESDSTGQRFSVRDMLKFDSSTDPNCILGNRWACKGGSVLWIGQSGIGKSSSSIQAMILWSLGKSFFGIQPPGGKQLKSLLIQAENDFGDSAEMFQGVIKELELTEDEISIVEKNIVVIKNSHATGAEFCAVVQKLVDRHKPDFCWFDPLMAFIGDDISKQSVCSQFFRNWLNPISEATGVCWMIVHHTNKPVAAKDRKGMTTADKAYQGAGSAELVNWARAICILHQVNDHEYEFLTAKRGMRAGMLSYENERTIKIRLEHSQKGICWNQIPFNQPEKDDAEKPPGRPGKAFDFDGFLPTIKGEHLRISALVSRAAKFSGMSERTFYKKVSADLKSRLKFDPEFDTYSNL